MNGFIEIREGDSARLINLRHVREAFYTPSDQRLVLHILGVGNEHILTLEGPEADEAIQQIRRYGHLPLV
jgi:hypothetical protein